MKKTLVAILLTTSTIGYAQQWDVSLIPDSVKTGAHAVVRKNQRTYTINEKLEITQEVEVVITSFNKIGDDAISTVIGYNPLITINSAAIEVYDEKSKQIEKFKSKDFYDISYVSNGQLYTDERIKYYNYVPVKYPYTLVFKYNLTSKNSLIPTYYPISKYKVGVEDYSLTIINNATSKLKTHELNLDKYNVAKKVGEKSITYTLSNAKPVEQEEYQGSVSNIAPSVAFTLEEFNFYNTAGSFNDWDSYGKWYAKLIGNKNDFTEKEQTFFKEMVKDASSNEEKIKILYKYLQQTKRYVGVQLGIGGFVPFSAKYVHEKGYGDCKALTYYMKSMLEAVGINSYYTVVEAGTKVDFHDNFSSIEQGNHVILMVPNGQDSIWLESTSMTSPFNYLGTFTYDRKAALVMPDGGKLVKTQSIADISKYTHTLKTTVGSNGPSAIQAQIKGEGLYYETLEGFNNLTNVKQKEALVNIFRIKDSKDIESFDFSKDWDNAACNLTAHINTSNIITHQSDMIIIPAVINNRFSSNFNPKRTNDIYIDLPTAYHFENEITLEKEMQLDGGQVNKQYNTKYGSYALECTQIAPNKVLIKRTLNIPQGKYAVSESKALYDFFQKITIADNSKIILK